MTKRRIYLSSGRKQGAGREQGESFADLKSHTWKMEILKDQKEDP